jgi:ATP-dependent Zn protease
MKERKTQQSSEQDMTVYAVHEAGHAVVGHVIGRLIEEVSIVPSRKYGYKGYCCFSIYIECLSE